MCDKSPTYRDAMDKMFPRLAIFALKYAERVCTQTPEHTLRIVRDTFRAIDDKMRLVEMYSADCQMIGITNSCLWIMAENDPDYLGHDCWIYVNDNGMSFVVTDLVMDMINDVMNGIWHHYRLATMGEYNR